MAKIGQKFAVEYCSYKGLTLMQEVNQLIVDANVEYCSYKGLTLNR